MNMTRLRKLFVIAVWALFVASVLLLDWREPSVLYIATNLVGVVGLAIAIVWLFLEGRWRYYCLLASATLLLLYAAQWTFQLIDIYSASPHGGISAALYRLVESWGILFNWRREKFGTGWAILAIYWDAIVVILQIVLIWLLLTGKGARAHASSSESSAVG